MAKQPKQYFISACGYVEPYCYLTKPDFGNEKFKQPRGLYKVSLTISNDDERCQKMKQLILNAHEANYKAAVAQAQEANRNKPQVRGKPSGANIKQGPIPFVETPEENVTTFNFKSYASYTDKSNNVVANDLNIHDSKGVLIKNPPAIGEGSHIKVKFSLVPYNTTTAGAGIKLQLESVMLIKLVEFTGSRERDSWDESEFESDGYLCEAMIDPVSEYDNSGFSEEQPPFDMDGNF